MKPHSVSLTEWIKAVRHPGSAVEVKHEDGTCEYITIGEYNHRDVTSLRNTRVRVLTPTEDVQ